MKRTALIMTFTVFLIGTIGTTEARVYKPHSQINDPTLVTQLRQQMNQLSDGFSEMETHETTTEIDYEKIIQVVNKMEATRRTIRQIVPDKAWNNPLKGLSAQLNKVHQAASRKNPATLRKEIDSLYNSCFSCHAANAPKYD